MMGKGLRGHLALKMEEPRKADRTRDQSRSECPEGKQPCGRLDFSPVRPGLDSQLRSRELIRGQCCCQSETQGNCGSTARPH